MHEPTQLLNVLLTNPPGCPSEDWARQRSTAEAIEARFGKNLDTVMLADEVGMGKTYVALAVMAADLFRSDANDRKVLLVTPPSAVLRDKWHQDILSFNKKYLTQEACARKELQPMMINTYWDLLRNLKTFPDQNVLRVSEANRLCFTWCMFNWAFARGQLGKRRRIPWAAIKDLHLHDHRILKFFGSYSEHAIWRFLDSDFGQRAHFYRNLFHCLQDGTFDIGSRFGRVDAADLFKRFTEKQGKYEPNIYIIGMNALARPRMDDANNRFLSKYLLAHLLFRRRPVTWRKHAAILVGENILPDDYVGKHSHRWKLYAKSMQKLLRSEFYGLRKAVIDVIQTSEVQTEWRRLSESIMRGLADGAQSFFKLVGNLVFKAQLNRANVGLAVVDEVHNWKGGAFGAQAFRDSYAPGINHKLLMSATPFQMEEGELSKIFGFVQASGGGSETVIRAAQDSEITRFLYASNEFSIAWKELSAVPAQAARLQGIFQSDVPQEVEATTARIAGNNAETDEMRKFAAALGTYREMTNKLQAKLGQVLIRHTNSHAKRNFRIGDDFNQPNSGNPQNALYPAIGYASENHALVNFIGMRLGQLVQREGNESFEANAHLLGGLTSSKAAFREGARKLGKTPATVEYRTLFEHILDGRMHPKVAATVDMAFQNFEAGRKTLIFCERVATLKEIEQALNKKIDCFISAQGDSSAIERRNLLKRKELIENLWWHSLWEACDQRTTGTALLVDYLPEAKDFAKRCLEKARVYPSARHIIKLLDVWLIGKANLDGRLSNTKWMPALAYFKHAAAGMNAELVAESDLASFSMLRDFLAPKYGKQFNNEGSGDEDTDKESRDKHRAGLDVVNISEAIEKVARQQYVERKNLWLMEDGSGYHRLLWKLLNSEALQLRRQQEVDVPEGQEAETAMVFFDVLDDLIFGIQKVTLRDDLLVRYDRASNANSAVARIAEGMGSMRIGHDSSMMARVNRFLNNLLEADGSISRADLTQSKRKSMWQGVSVGHTGSVATLQGSTPTANRAGLCAAFNSPLLPDILICTSIGSEGIDLHRQCADLIHHDLPWNPAKLEQRNGRVDRVGSLAAMSDALFINIGIPFLAHNYEQYQYRKVYSRAQRFEVLLGQPQFDAADIDEDLRNESADAASQVRIAADDDTHLCPLPQAVMKILRLDLSVQKCGHLP